MSLDFKEMKIFHLTQKTKKRMERAMSAFLILFLCVSFFAPIGTNIKIASASVGQPSSLNEVIITEVMPDPKAVNDSEGEWFEVFNNSNQSYDLLGCIISDEGGGNTHTIESTLFIGVDQYLVFGKNATTSENGGVIVDYVYPSSFDLANTRDEIYLKCNSVLIDEVEYSSSFPFDSGASMVLGDFSADNNKATNWCVSTSSFGDGDLGTPGEENDSCVPICDDSDGDGVCDGDDNCANISNSNQSDSDGDGVGDVCDNCVEKSNADQSDGDGDGYGDACDCNSSNPGMQDRLCCFVDEDEDDYFKPYPYVSNDGVARGEFCYCTDGDVHDICSDSTEGDFDGEDCDDTDPALTDDCSGSECVGNEDCTSGQFCDNGFCLELELEVCDDGIDNDNDGDVDCNDSDCLQASNCTSDECISTISGHKYLYDNGETTTGLEGWEISLSGILAGDPIATTTTDIDGYYEFTDVCLGSYRVSETINCGSGWTAVTPVFGNYLLVIIEDEGTDLTLDFYNEQTGPLPICGDGTLYGDEQCDDGNNANGDGCNEFCQIEYCGDGVINQAWEQCDGGEGCEDTCQLTNQTECSDLVLARVNVDEVNNFDDDDSDMTSNIYLGSSAYFIPAGTWFPLFWSGVAFLDADIATYEDVPGFAVERSVDGVRAVMYGTHTSKDKEHIHGNIEFYNATVLELSSDESNANPKNNRLEPEWDDGSGIGKYDAGDDEVWFEDGNDYQSFFWLTTTTADDGYYTSWQIDEVCDGVISGYKYNDLNGNGILDDEGVVIENWEMRLIGCPYPPLGSGVSQFLPNSSINYDPNIVGACVVMATTTTNSLGYYEFTDLPAGDYGVSEAQVDHWQQTLPAGDMFYHFNLVEGSSTTTINFANHQEEYCGDDVCNNDETCETCEVDCGECEGDCSGDKTWTVDSDFDEGSMINVVHNPSDQLQLDNTVETFNFIWVAVSSKSTVVKINTDTGEVVGEYSTRPATHSFGNPSRTTVDNDGSVWVANRNNIFGGKGSIVHIGLEENGQCEDRNGNGVIDTSTGLDDIMDWADTSGSRAVATAEDECIVHYTKVDASGTRHVSVDSDNNVWVAGLNSRNFQLVKGGKYDVLNSGTIIRSESSVGYGGYGGLIDGNGVIWSARNLLRWDTNNPLTGGNGTNWDGYSHDSYGLCIDSAGNVWNTSLYGNEIRKFAPDGTLIGTYSHGASNAQGCVVDNNDHVWVAHSLWGSSVGHLLNDGTYIGKVTVGSGPTGLAVDANGKIWATHNVSNNVMRIDPNLGDIGADGITKIGAVDYTGGNLGGNLYNYSDMTGSTLFGMPDNGTWIVEYNSDSVGYPWNSISWSENTPGNSYLSVSVATSSNGTTWATPQAVVSGANLSSLNSQYLRIVVSFTRSTEGESPVLYDLTVDRDCGSEPICGNDVLESGEECDDGNNVDGDGCSASCTNESNGGDTWCGDGIVNNEEQCDDGNSVNGDGCDMYCLNESNLDTWCGDGMVNNSEECDDGNNINGDGCSSSCQTESSSSSSSGGSSSYWLFTQNQGTTPIIPQIPDPEVPSDEVLVLGEEGAPNLEITKEVVKEFANQGDKNILYTVTVKNSGNLIAFGVALEDVLPAGLIFSDADGSTKSWDLGDINPGEEKVVTYNVDVPEGAEVKVYENVATVSAVNSDPVTAMVDLEVREILVLAETGFSIGEFAGLMLGLVSLSGTTLFLRRKASLLE